VRHDLEILIKHARQLGFYINLITSAMGLNENRLSNLKKLGLDNIQISFQAEQAELNDYYAGKKSFTHKFNMAKLVKQYGYPLVLNIVLHRDNIDHIQNIMDLALELEANYVELANTQYYGFALHNRDRLLPNKTQLATAEKIAHEYQTKYKDKTTFYYIVSDYFEKRPKACMNGWGRRFLTITPDGYALPCLAARVLPNLNFPKITEHSLAWIWQQSDLFNLFRGEDWMKEPCRSCSERKKDFAGCRCQAYLLTGDAANTDPICDLSPHHDKIDKFIQQAQTSIDKPLLFRTAKNSKRCMQ
jgi:PqqA peptide cyclase